MLPLSTCTAIACGCLIFGGDFDERHYGNEKEHGPRGCHGENMGGPARIRRKPGLLLRLRYETGGRQGPGAAAPVLSRPRRAAPQAAASGAARRSFPAGY